MARIGTPAQAADQAPHKTVTDQRDTNGGDDEFCEAIKGLRSGNFAMPKAKAEQYVRTRHGLLSAPRIAPAFSTPAAMMLPQHYACALLGVLDFSDTSRQTRQSGCCLEFQRLRDGVLSNHWELCTPSSLRQQEGYQRTSIVADARFRLLPDGAVHGAPYPRSDGTPEIRPAWWRRLTYRPAGQASHAQAEGARILTVAREARLGLAFFLSGLCGVGGVLIIAFITWSRRRAASSALYWSALDFATETPQ